MVAKFPFSEPEALLVDPVYARMRREEPVRWVEFPHGGEGWLVTRFEDAKFVYSDPRFSLQLSAGADVPRMRSNIMPPGAVATTDGPDHTRLRRLIGKAFTSRRVEALRPRVQEIADGLLDQVDNPGDLVSGFAMPLPVTVMCELLGVPYADRADFQLWSEQTMSTFGSVHAPENATDGALKLFGYISELVAKRRAEPTDDLLGALVVARDEGDALSELELVVFGTNLLVAGHESVANELGNMIITLSAHPEAMALLRAEPESLPGAIEELLRFVPLPAGAGLTRIAAEDVQVGDVLMRQGDAVLIVTASANRDESVFDRPEELDLHRVAARQHLAFGHGPHFCPGAQLARMMLQVSLGTVLRRMPGLTLAEPPEFKKGSLLRGPRRLVVAW